MINTKNNTEEKEKVFDLLANRFATPETRDILSRKDELRALSSSSSLEPRTLALFKRLVGYGIKYPTDEEFYRWAKSKPAHFLHLHKIIISGLSRCIGNQRAYIILSEIEDYMWPIREALRKEDNKEL